MAGHAGRRSAGRTRPRLANPHRAHPPTGRTLRHAAAAAHRRSGRARRSRGSTSQEDGSSMEVKPGYKETEVGEIPEGWDVFAVRQMGEVVTGKALAVHAPGRLRPYLRTKNVFDGRIDIDDVLTMP